VDMGGESAQAHEEIQWYLEAVAVGQVRERIWKHLSLECQNGQSFNSHKTGQDS